MIVFLLYQYYLRSSWKTYSSGSPFLFSGDVTQPGEVDFGFANFFWSLVQVLQVWDALQSWWSYDPMWKLHWLVRLLCCLKFRFPSVMVFDVVVYLFLRSRRQKIYIVNLYSVRERIPILKQSTRYTQNRNQYLL